MKSLVLDRLVASGISGIPQQEVAGLIDTLQKTCIRTGDARYCVLSSTLEAVEEWRYMHEERGGVPAQTLVEIDDLVTTALPNVLDSLTAAEGAQLASDLFESIRLLLGDSRLWVKRGQARRIADDG